MANRLSEEKQAKISKSIINGYRIPLIMQAFDFLMVPSDYIVSRTGYSSATVSKWRKGRAEIPLYMVYVLAYLLDDFSKYIQVDLYRNHKGDPKVIEWFRRRLNLARQCEKEMIKEITANHTEDEMKEAYFKSKSFIQNEMNHHSKEMQEDRDREWERVKNLESLALAGKAEGER